MCQCTRRCKRSGKRSCFGMGGPGRLATWPRFVPGLPEVNGRLAAINKNKKMHLLSYFSVSALRMWDEMPNHSSHTPESPQLCLTQKPAQERRQNTPCGLREALELGGGLAKEVPATTAAAAAPLHCSHDALFTNSLGRCQKPVS